MVVQLYTRCLRPGWPVYADLPRYGVPRLAGKVRRLQGSAKSRYAHAQVDGPLKTHHLWVTILFSISIAQLQ